MVRGDHFCISVTSNDATHLDAAIRIAFAGEQPATHFRVAPVKEYPDRYDALGDRLTAPALQLFRPYKGETIEGLTALPYPLDASRAARFAGDWLADAMRPPHPDIDGSCEADAFTVRGGARGGERAIVVIVPEWSIYHK